MPSQGEGLIATSSGSSPSILRGSPYRQQPNDRLWIEPSASIPSPKLSTRAATNGLEFSIVCFADRQEDMNALSRNRRALKTSCHADGR